LGAEQLNQILSIELNRLQQRIFDSAMAAPFVFNVTQEARALLLREGTDLKYGARHLKRAIERSLVHPLSNLVASGQIHGGDFLRIDFDPELGVLDFIKEAENMPVYAMKQMMDTTQPSLSAATAASQPNVEVPRVANAKSHRTR
jgi:ATP-dependent Clp protease ATP-binding subunit ClpB